MTRETRTAARPDVPGPTARQARLAPLFPVVLVVLGVLASAGLTLPRAARAQVAIPLNTTVSFANTSQIASFVVDLGSLPLRPELIVDALPETTDPNLRIQIEISEVQIASPGGNNFCPSPTASLFSPPSVGPARLTWAIWSCDPLTGGLVGETARVEVRVLDFGGVPAPLDVVIAMRGVTAVPSATQNMRYWSPGAHSITLRPSKDTTIYERAPDGSNGAGQFLWAGRDVDTSSPFAPFAVRSILTFPIRQGVIPQNATIDSATLRLDVESITGSGNTLQVWGGSPEGRWDEGLADAAGSEFQAGSTIYSAADWLLRSRVPELSWGFEGGNPDLLLSTQAVTTTGIKTFSSTALRDHVESILNDGSTVQFTDSFVLRGAETSTASSGMQISSRENLSVGATPPELVVGFTVPGEPQQSTPASGAVTFIGEGQNLRWIYDLDHDDDYETPIDGLCTVLGPSSNQMPYSYAFNGTPGYSGLDCCSWHLDSPDTGTLGTGQLIFFHNLDPEETENDPPDTDADGMFDLCDNCPLNANGPSLGSCLTGPETGGPCRSNQECTAGLCSLSQEDANGDGTGDACVPEPGFGATLAVGLMGLAGWARRRPRAGVRAAPGR